VRDTATHRMREVSTDAPGTFHITDAEERDHVAAFPQPKQWKVPVAGKMVSDGL